MSVTAIRTPEGAKRIIEYNIQLLYHIPTKYKYTALMLKDVKQELLKILNFIKDLTPIISQQKYTWFLPNEKVLLEKIGIKKGKSTCSRHFNYLCCLGVITKVKQTPQSMIGINREFLLETGISRPMNVITVSKYNEKQLEQIEQRAKRLYENKITPGNISADRLKANNCLQIAKEVFDNTDKSLEKKEKQLEHLIECIESLCDKNGYTNKSIIYGVMKKSFDVDHKELDTLFRVFKEQIYKRYTYKAPNKNEMKQYKLLSKKWIIIKKEIRENESKNTCRQEESY